MSNADRLIADAIQTLGEHAMTRRYQALLSAVETVARRWRADEALHMRDRDPNWVGTASSVAATLRGCATDVEVIVRAHRDPTYQP